MFQLLRGCCRTFAFGVLVVALVGPSSVFAQVETGNIVGTIVDGTNAALPGVTVSALNVATQQLRTTVTNAVGRYQLSGLPPSQCNLTAELQGFNTMRRQSLSVSLGSVVEINFQMELAGVQESVTVTGAAPLVERAKTDVSAVITTTQLERLPSKSHQYLDFAQLLPATTENVSTTQQGSGLNIGGARSKEGALLVDGFYNMDESFGLPRQRYSQEAIREFQVVTFGGAAEVRSRDRRDHQCRHQVRWQHFQRGRLRLLPEYQAERAGFCPAAVGRLQVRLRLAAVGRNVRRADRARQDVLLRSLRARQRKLRLCEFDQGRGCRPNRVAGGRRRQSAAVLSPQFCHGEG